MSRFAMCAAVLLVGCLGEMDAIERLEARHDDAVPAEAGPRVDVSPTPAVPLGDAGTVAPDAGLRDVDAGTVDADAGVPMVDGGAMAIDAGAPTPDAGMTGPDAGSTRDA